MELDYKKKHKLGHRAYFVFLAKRIKFAFFMFLLTWTMWYFSSSFPEKYQMYTDYSAELLLVLSIAYLVFISIQTWLEYRAHTYTFTDEAFVVTHGYITRNELAAAYHHIQSVNIRRSPLDRMIGVSQIVILMTGSEQGTRRSEIILPAVGRTKARLVQKELLVKARKHSVATSAE